ncbi:hypothetical protein GCM10010169_24890 [Micromonospora fulviviridis]|nr:hypothetical protein GCM10010169_24890 [Micromonospora fulviviridis]
MPEELLRESNHALPGAQGTSAAPARALKTVLRPAAGRPVGPPRTGDAGSRGNPDGDRPDVTFFPLAALFAAFNRSGKLKARISPC